MSKKVDTVAYISILKARREVIKSNFVVPGSPHHPELLDRPFGHFLSMCSNLFSDQATPASEQNGYLIMLLLHIDNILHKQKRK